ncbi:MAG: hypothetical protein HQL42_06250 [Alphaproteobacteria bacterium]|nr:hypothetical protein [Alphaproteobacteria bacterium]
MVTLDVGETIPAALVVELACKPEGDESVHPEGVRIDMATIFGCLNFEGRTLTRPLWLSQCTIASGINLNHARAKVLGLVDCPRIGGIEADNLRTDGSLILSGSKVQGRAFLIGGQVDGDVDCSGAHLDGYGGPALQADRLKVVGALFLREGFRAKGLLVLDHAAVGTLVDDPDCWPTPPGGLSLNGFTYDAIAAHCRLDARSRLDWLHLQPKEGFFDPQPYEQLAKVMKAQGHNADARAVLIAKERDRRPFLPRRKRVLSFWFDALVGYGYRPWLAAVWMAVFIAGGALAVAQADHLGHMVPAKERVYMDKLYAESRVLPAEYPHLQPVVYSLDVFLPFVDLQQEDYWMPTDQRGQARVFGRGMMLWRWLHIALGWALSALFVAGITGLIKKE